MGLFDFFKPKDPTLDQFADLLIKALKSAGLSGTLTKDPEAQSIRIEDEARAVFLSYCSYYQEYLQTPKERRSDYLKYRASMYVGPPESIPEDFATARPNLRPKIWSRLALESVRLHILETNPESSGLDSPQYELGSHLVAGIAYDTPETMLSVNRDSFEKWGVTYYETLEIARENLAAQPYSAGRIGGFVFMVNNNDGYDACRMLVPAIIDNFPVQGDHIAVVPNRDLLLVTGSEDLKGLEILLELIEQFADHPRPILPLPLRRDGVDWDDWMPDSSHPLYQQFKNHEYRYLLGAYEQQNQDLERLFQKTGKDVFVCQYQVYKLEDESYFSRSIWSCATEFLLPPTDNVVFRKPEGGPMIEAPWARVQEVLGNLMQPTDYYPPRVLIQSPDFPSDEILARLAD